VAYETLCELFSATVAGRGDRPALAQAGHPGYSWTEYAGRVARVASGLAELGVRHGEPVALALGPSPEFHVVDTALFHLGAVPFSLQDRDTVEHDVDNLRLAGVHTLITDLERREHVRKVVDRHGAITNVVVVDAEPGGGRELSLVDLLDRTAAVDLDVLRKAVDPEDIATLIFTSGTTGAPKAVQLSHRAITSAVRGTLALAPSVDGDALSYLPLNHIAERFMSHYTALATGTTIHSVPDPAALYDEIVRIRPTRFFGIPRIYEKLATRARALIEADPALVAALELSRRKVRADQERRQLPDGVVTAADAALGDLAPVRVALGLDRAEFLGVATAPSSAAMLEFFLSLGLRVSDIWGMSEIIMCTLNPPHAIRLGSVGRFLPGVEGRIAPNGEVQVRGSNAFSGYLGDPLRTAETMDPDGWVSTGDLGSIEDGYLSIRGRKKEILITATGKNISPAAVEAALKDASPLIEHAVAIADGRRYVTALVALDPDALAAFAAQHGHSGAFAELSTQPDVRAAIADAVASANLTLAGPETVRAVEIASEPWSPGGDELTATSKLRRDEVARKYADTIERLYQ